MRLERVPADPGAPDLDRQVGAVLDRRLTSEASAHLAVAYSGGGDSLALLLAARAWAGAHGRAVIAMTLDHRLQAGSAAWSRACAQRAARLGVDFRALDWEGHKPARGLPAAARAARHRLLAEAARAAGARVLLMGHTADDLAEARLMRRSGATTPEPREWSPSPAWPEGRGLFVLRPLLGLGRAEIRDWLRARGETCIEDPANSDPRYARARARAALASGAAPPPPEAPPPDLAGLALACEAEAWGGLSVSRDALRAASAEALPVFLAIACLCVAGGVRPPRGERLQRLAARLGGEGAMVATLAGARIEADAASVRFMREAGEASRGGLAPLVPSPGEPAVWDGRFEVVADRPSLTVRALSGRAARLPPEARRALRPIPAPARRALPAVIDEAGTVGCPLLGPPAGLAINSLAHGRLLAACGLVTREPP